jgi:hypothetical protein
LLKEINGEVASDGEYLGDLKNSLRKLSTLAMN